MTFEGFAQKPNLYNSHIFGFHEDSKFCIKFAVGGIFKEDYTVSNLYIDIKKNLIAHKKCN